MLEILNIYFKWNCGDRSKNSSKVDKLLLEFFRNGVTKKYIFSIFWLILNKVKGENNGWNNFNK